MARSYRQAAATGRGSRRQQEGRRDPKGGRQAGREGEADEANRRQTSNDGEGEGGRSTGRRRQQSRESGKEAIAELHQGPVSAEPGVAPHSQRHPPKGNREQPQHVEVPRHPAKGAVGAVSSRAPPLGY